MLVIGVVSNNYPALILTLCAGSFATLSVCASRLKGFRVVAWMAALASLVALLSRPW